MLELRDVQRVGLSVTALGLCVHGERMPCPLTQARREAARHRRRRLHRLDRRAPAARAGHDVVVLDSLERGIAPRSPRPVRAADLRDAGRQRRAVEGSTASCTSPRWRSWASRSSHPERYYRDQRRAARSTCSTRCATAGVPRLVFSSTCAVYGQPDEVPISEDGADAPGQPLRRVQARRRPDDLRLLPRPRARARSACATSTSPGPAASSGEDHEPETHLIPNVLRAATGPQPARRDLRHRLPDARRHRDPRLHPHRGPLRRAPARARTRPRRASTRSSTSATATGSRCAR